MLDHYTDYNPQFLFKTQMAINDKIFTYDSESSDAIFLRNIFDPTKLIKRLFSNISSRSIFEGLKFILASFGYVSLM